MCTVCDTTKAYDTHTSTTSTRYFVSVHSCVCMNCFDISLKQTIWYFGVSAWRTKNRADPCRSARLKYCLFGLKSKVHPSKPTFRDGPWQQDRLKVRSICMRLSLYATIICTHQMYRKRLAGSIYSIVTTLIKANQVYILPRATRKAQIGARTISTFLY